MAYLVVKSRSQYNLDCYQMSAPIWQVQRILGHDPRSKHWKTLEPWMRDIYEAKQRTTSTPRITALKAYMTERLMAQDKFGALPPISIIQFEPLAPDQLTELGHGAFLLEEGKSETSRVMIDGLARYSAAIETREQLRQENPGHVQDLDDAFEFSIALYVPKQSPIDASIAGQLFTDFNSYAWNVPSAKTLAQDNYNPYKQVALIVNRPGGLLRKYGGVKSGSSNLGRKDTAWTTEMQLSQFCKIAIEGQKGLGKLNRPVSNPQITKLDLEDEAHKIADFLEELEREMGSDRFADRTQLFRSAHGLYALAVIVNDALYEGRTTVADAVRGIASIDWTWSNLEFRKDIGRVTPSGDWKLNTGTASITYLINYTRPRCQIHLSVAA